MPDFDPKAAIELCEEVDQRCAKATPGPWAYPAHNFPEGVSTDCGTCQLIATVADRWVGLSWVKGTPESNGQFIAHSRADLPALSRHLRAAVAEVERLKADAERYCAYMHAELDAARQEEDGK